MTSLLRTFLLKSLQRGREINLAMLFPFRSKSKNKTVCCSSTGDNKLDDQKELINRDNPSGTSTSAIFLTCWRKSLLFSCQGFTVIGSDGSLVFRVDNYAGRRRPNQVILMDGSGMPILTMLRWKKLGLVNNWLIFEGEVDDYSRKMTSKKPIFNVRKSLNVLQKANLNVLAYAYRGMSDERYSYVIEGSYAIRSCKVLDESRKVVAEIKKKEANVGGVSFGAEVFNLVVYPGFDSGLAMALILLLDQMFS